MLQRRHLIKDRLVNAEPHVVDDVLAAVAEVEHEPYHPEFVAVYPLRGHPGQGDDRYVADVGHGWWLTYTVHDGMAPLVSTQVVRVEAFTYQPDLDPSVISAPTRPIVAVDPPEMTPADDPLATSRSLAVSAAVGGVAAVIVVWIYRRLRRRPHELD